jgi:hypothetical protein
MQNRNEAIEKAGLHKSRAITSQLAASYLFHLNENTMQSYVDILATYDEDYLYRLVTDLEPLLGMLKGEYRIEYGGVWKHSLYVYRALYRKRRNFEIMFSGWNMEMDIARLYEAVRENNPEQIEKISCYTIKSHLLNACVEANNFEPLYRRTGFHMKWLELNKK